jgi:hypothetical protein
LAGGDPLLSNTPLSFDWIDALLPSNVEYQETLNRMIAYFLSLGSSASDARRQATAWIGRQIHVEASLLAYIDVFHTLMLLAALVIPLALICGRRRQSRNQRRRTEAPGCSTRKATRQSGRVVFRTWSCWVLPRGRM